MPVQSATKYLITKTTSEFIIGSTQEKNRIPAPFVHSDLPQFVTATNM